MTTLALILLAAAPAESLDALFAKVDPAVVTVRVVTKTTAQTETSALVALATSFGSGVLVHPGGFVVTAAHVVDSAESIDVQWSDGFKAEARVVTLSRTEDLALLKVAQLPPKAVVAPLGDSDRLKPGQRLFAIGAPYGLEHSLTAGVVSALRSNLGRGLVPKHLVQTDVPINQGNSGGPLFNDRGEVVGIASFILSRSGGSVGLNFAVPSNTVRHRLFDEALPYIGVALRFIPRDIAELFNWPVDAAFLVEVVRPGSPAEAGGLRGGKVEAEVGGNEVRLGGDLIVAVNGVSAAEPDRVAKALRALKAGERIRYDVLRAGRPAVVEVEVPGGFEVPELKRLTR
jgi:S1-C subfamily serine protease